MFFVTAFLVILVKVVQQPDLENIFKPNLLMILIFWYGIDAFLFKNKLNITFLFALLFSLLGDVFLMPAFDNFILGLVFFLLAHFFYIFVFLKGNTKVFFPLLRKGKVFTWQIISSYLALLIVLMVFILKTDQFVLYFAIPVYASIILVMVLSAFVYSKVHFYRFGKYILIGALLFFLSDGLLALNKFVVEIPYSSIWVMGSYSMAQWFLVFGYMNSQKALVSKQKVVKK
jgi:uncharacterized membrane protein YhhN